MRHGRSVSGKWRTACRAGIFAVVVVSATSLHARTVVTLTGENIPASYAVGSQLIFDQSDSLYLSGRLLTRGEDYLLDVRRGVFDLSSLATTSVDTLIIIYRKVPSWALGSFGNTVPDVSAGGRSKVRRQLAATPSSGSYR
ncbi:MAG: hypothetical protein KAT79_06985, partial [candidate division Zixibacteria bacterium]|nr:hypothetical protein [candidate division Zixibacteria bacterium]